ncbi:hypothetical protein BDW60DRAFT_126004 [Aspergillus nidulans var. acristatus]|jgi:hypothetical protein
MKLIPTSHHIPCFACIVQSDIAAVRACSTGQIGLRNFLGAGNEICGITFAYYYLIRGGVNVVSVTGSYLLVCP